MGHYDSAYEYDAAEALKERKKEIKHVKTLLEMALTAGKDCAAEHELFSVKIKEAIFWLENNI